MKTELQTITPELAKRYLEHNKSNRPLRINTVAKYAIEMKMGRWDLNHQGIAFNELGELVDGQHRLRAIVESGCTVQMLVTLELPSDSGFNIDKLSCRKDGDTLAIAIKTSNGAIYTSIAKCIAEAGASVALNIQTFGSMLSIVNIYRQELDFLTQFMAPKRQVKGIKSPFLGACAFAMFKENADSEFSIHNFVCRMFTGSNLSEDFARVRNWMARGKPTRFQMYCATFNAAKSWINKETTIVKDLTSYSGLNYFRKLQEEQYHQIRGIFTMD